MLESCSLECQKVAKRLPKVKKMLRKFLDTFFYTNDEYSAFVFHNNMLTLGKKNSLKLNFKELLANMGEI